MSLKDREYCPGVNNQPYISETGHCCGETGCCTYYYELWWFWLLWTVLILFSCCCAYRHRCAKMRLQQHQREINLIAYHGACNYPPSMLDLRMLASFKLPDFFEVDCHQCSYIEEVDEEEEEGDEEHLQHRQLTGDSGIEVCRCQVQGEESEEELHLLHDSPGCSGRAKELNDLQRGEAVQPSVCESLCGYQDSEELGSPGQPV
ncbi:WW domain-binding protein 1-like [Microcaecilia unicolor]|uniref:WW domain-binding protein 1-like n=1 Tax=Microcaecilia unicolor TaxID=1415580 RepID=A0A6P7YTX4_9AMPH|nr:WW domain-binding protein 1-like [Microcaecilia unicolor]